MVVERLRRRGMAVRAMVHREDERAAVLRATGAEVVVGDLTVPVDVVRAMEACRRIYSGMSVSASYLEATAIAAAAAREHGDIEAFVNISQMTVSQMSLTNMTESPQHQQHWLAEQVLNWSGTPGRAGPPDGVPRESALHGPARSVDCKGRYDSAAPSARDGPRRLRLKM